MSLKFKIAGNTLAQFISKAITSGATFIITVHVARQYGAVGYGDFTKIFSYIVIFYLLADFGINAVFLRESKERDKQFHIASLLSIRFVFSIILLILAVALVSFLPYYPETGDGYSLLVKLGILFLSPTIITMGLQSSFNALFQKHLRYDKATLATLIGSVTTFSIVILFSYMQASVAVLMTGYLIGGIVTVIAAYMLSRSLAKWSSVHWLSQLSSGNNLLKLSIPLGLTLVFSVILFRVDVFILTIYRSTHEVGIYGLASKFFEFALTIPTFYMNAVYPVLLTVITNQKKSIVIVKNSIYLLGGTSVLLLLIGIYFAPYIPLIKEDFVDSIIPFKILMFTLPLFFSSSVLMWYLIAKGKTWLLVRIYAVGMVVNVVLNIIFIPQYGVIAAAIMTGVSEGILLLLLIYYVYPLFVSNTKANQ